MLCKSNLKVTIPLGLALFLLSQVALLTSSLARIDRILLGLEGSLLLLASAFIRKEARVRIHEIKLVALNLAQLLKLVDLMMPILLVKTILLINELLLITVVIGKEELDSPTLREKVVDGVIKRVGVNHCSRHC